MLASSSPITVSRRMLRFPRQTQALSLVCGLLVCGSSLTTPRAHADQWTNMEGTATIDAAFLGMWGDKIVLRRSDGKRIAIDKMQLNAESRLRAEEMAANKAEARARRIAELQSKEGEVPGIPELKPSAPYAAMPEAGDLAATVQHVAEQLDAGHIRVLWDALPPSYQGDVEQLVQTIASNTQENDYAISMRLNQQIGRILVKQKDFVFGYPRISMIPQEPLRMIQDAYDPAAAIILELSDEETFSLENLRNTAFGEIVAAKDETMGPHIAALIGLLPAELNPLNQLRDLDPSAVEMQGDDRGVIHLVNPQGDPTDAVFVTVEGHWVPVELADNWDTMIANARQQIIAQSGQSSGASALALVAGPVLTQIENAETQQEFNRIIDQLLGILMQSMPQPGGLAGNSGGQSGAPSGRGPTGMNSGGDFNSGGSFNSGGETEGEFNSGGAQPPRGPVGASANSGGG